MTIDSSYAECGILVLAGGLGRRMSGADKGWVEWGGSSLVECILDQLQMQSSTEMPIVISANRNIQRYQSLGYPVLKDHNFSFETGGLGPLAGIQQALKSNRARRWITWPVDSPIVPKHYIKRMTQTQSPMVVAEQKGRKHYAHMSISERLSIPLEEYIHAKRRSIKGFLAQYPSEAVQFDLNEGLLLNFNTHEEAKACLRKQII